MTISVVTAEAKDGEREAHRKEAEVQSVRNSERMDTSISQSVGCRLFGGHMPDTYISIQSSIKITVMK